MEPGEPKAVAEVLEETLGTAARARARRVRSTYALVGASAAVWILAAWPSLVPWMRPIVLASWIYCAFTLMGACGLELRARQKERSLLRHLGSRFDPK